MTPWRRLRVLAQDLQGPLRVERSLKLGDEVSRRFLVMCPTDSRNQALIQQYAERSGLDVSQWLSWAVSSDHLGVCVSEFGDIRLYTQHMKQPDQPLYRGYKSYRDQTNRVDEYWNAAIADDDWHLSDDGPIASLLGALRDGVGARDDLLVTKIQGDQRQSVLVQCEYAQWLAAGLGKLYLGAKLWDPDEVVRHFAWGRDTRDTAFLNLYFDSNPGRLSAAA
ncbi:MAG: hypothetical protein ACPGU3_00770 [Litorivicinus sp.]